MRSRGPLLGLFGAYVATVVAAIGCSPPEVTFVVLPDTQYYASSWQDVFASQTRWIAENRDAHRIAFVLHTGDIVDSDVPEQWKPASAAMGALDGRVPYVVTVGNHDYTNIADRVGMSHAYFPPSRFEQHPWFGGTFEPGHIENSFSIFRAGGAKWLVLALEFGPRDEVLAWANDVLRAHARIPAIVITHAYLYRDGTRYDHVRSPNQQYNPHRYVMVGQPGTSVNDGEEVWTKLIEPNGNVRLVFCGHDVNGEGIPPGTAARLRSVRADGSVVDQILANYQTCTRPPCAPVRGGDGYLRIVRVRGTGDRIQVDTYSPYLDELLTDPANKFVLDERSP